jgi:hypothetical protein
METIGTCKLCDSEGPLEESHIVPSFVFKWLKNTSGTGLFRHGAQPNKRVQDGLKRYWLCRACEDRLNVWETKFATEIFHPFTKGLSNRAIYSAWLLKFCVSISWRTLTYLITEHRTAFGDFSPQLMNQTEKSLSEWKRVLLGGEASGASFEQHMLPLDAVASFTDPRTPVNINRYLLRAVELDVARAGETAFVYSKLGPFIILGFVSLKYPEQWSGGTKVDCRGTIHPQAYVLPESFGHYVYSRARRSRQILTAISDRQNEKTQDDFRRKMDRLATSETFRAVSEDVRLFGKRAFEIENDDPTG